jgi:hypothetical protein
MYESMTITGQREFWPSQCLTAIYLIRLKFFASPVLLTITFVHHVSIISVTTAPQDVPSLSA